MPGILSLSYSAPDDNRENQSSRIPVMGTKSQFMSLIIIYIHHILKQCECACAQACTCAHVYMCTCVRVCVHVCACVQVCVPACIYMFVYACVCLCTFCLCACASAFNKTEEKLPGTARELFPTIINYLGLCDPIAHRPYL